MINERLQHLLLDKGSNYLIDSCEENAQRMASHMNLSQEKGKALFAIMAGLQSWDDLLFTIEMWVVAQSYRMQGDKPTLPESVNKMIVLMDDSDWLGQAPNHFYMDNMECAGEEPLTHDLYTDKQVEVDVFTDQPLTAEQARFRDSKGMIKVCMSPVFMLSGDYTYLGVRERSLDDLMAYCINNCRKIIDHGNFNVDSSDIKFLQKYRSAIAFMLRYELGNFYPCTAGDFKLPDYEDYCSVAEVDGLKSTTESSFNQNLSMFQILTFINQYGFNNNVAIDTIIEYGTKMIIAIGHLNLLDPVYVFQKEENISYLLPEDSIIDNQQSKTIFFYMMEDLRFGIITQAKFMYSNAINDSSFDIAKH